MRISFLMVFIITTFLFSTSVTAYIIDDNTVYINNNKVYLSAYPHTLNESGYVYFNLTSKQYSGNIDFFFGFNSLQCKPISSEIFIDGNWIDISHRFNSINYDYDNLNKWYYLKEIPIYSNINYTLRAYLKINEISTGGKYGVAIKPSHETISQAINNNHFYYLDPWWNGSWLYRKTITLTGNTSGAQTDYQMLLNVTYDSDMQIDFDDLRFTNDTHQIDAWLESNTTDYALIWVEFPTTPTNGVDQDYYMYYGNVDIINNWNITNTFLFGDDFHGSSLDTNKWSIKDGSCSVSGGYAQPYGLPVFVITKDYTATNVVLHTKFIQASTYHTGIVFRSTNETRNVADFYMSYIRIDNTLKLVKMVNDVRTDFNSKAYTQGAATYEQHITYNGTALNVDIWKNATADSLAATGDGARSDGRIGFTNYFNVAEGNVKFDYIFARKYAANLPTYAFGDEEILVYILSDPTNLQNVTGNFWINHTWQPGVGNITDSYNISANDIWHNETINTYWNIIYGYGNNSWQNITIWAYNNTGMSSLSSNSISQNTQLFFTNLPTNLQKTHNHTWINWTWNESFIGTHIIDSYNVSINDTWYNSTTNQFYNHTGYDYGITSSIIVYGYNDTQGLSIYCISGSHTFLTKYKIVEVLKQLVTPIQIIKDKFFNIIPFIISIILFAGFGLAIMVMTSRLKKW